jgi:UDP-N-acetylglucosamine acyltransferase
VNIHPTAIISPEATLADGVDVGPYSIIGPDVHIGKNTLVGPHVVIETQTDIGENNRIAQFASIGGAPQDLKYRGEPTRVVIGNHNNLLMAYCHVAHNCKLGDHVVMANAANLAGHVHVEDHAIIGGLTGIHQFTRIGAHCIIGGASAVTKDIPPFVMASGNFAKLFGLNTIGLKRRGFTDETIAALKEAYRIVFRSSRLLADAIQNVEHQVEDLPEVRQFLDFIRKSERGICR